MELPSKSKKQRLETSEEKRARLDKNNERQRAKRRAETDEQKQERRSKRNARDRARRAAETPEQRKNRLDRKKAYLADESSPQRLLRLDNMRNASLQRLETETPEQREIRLQHLKELQQQRLESETPDQREVRLQRLQEIQQQRLESETPDQREVRLQQLQELQQQRLESETPDQREVRLQRLKELQQQRLESETPDQRADRLKHLKILQQQRLEAETSENRKARLDCVHFNNKKRIQAETPQQNLDRLQQMSLTSARLRRNSSTSMPISSNDRPVPTLNNDRPVPTLNNNQVKQKINIFHKDMASIQALKCSICLERFPGIKMVGNGSQCSRCYRDKTDPKLFSAGNNMDPGPVPAELQDLSQVEEMLISAVIPIMSVYKLPHGQYGYKGHVINLPQDITTFATSLPRLPKELDILIVRKKGSDSTHRDFRVRKNVVLKALIWLKQHNKYYRNVNIDYSALNDLPEDGNLPNLGNIAFTSNTEKESLLQDTSDENPYDAQSFVPIAIKKLTELEAVKKTIQEKQQMSTKQTVPWPDRVDVPVNEFVTEGYMSCAFPTLFPTGAGDFLAPRERAVTVGYYFKHLMRYDDGRFAKHPRFRYFALNSEMRWRALQAGRVYIKQNPKDARMSLDELKSIVDSGGEQFAKKVLHYACKLRGTKQYWFKQRIRLIAMIDKLGLPTIFFTHSAIRSWTIGMGVM